MMQQSITLETAGGLLQSLGTAQFTSRLWQWLHEVVDPSSYHMTALRFRRGSQQAVVEQLDVLFFAGEADPNETQLALSLYQRDMEWKQDRQLLQFIEQVQDPQLVLSRNDIYPATAYGRMIAQSPWARSAACWAVKPTMCICCRSFATDMRLPLRLANSIACGRPAISSFPCWHGMLS
jgi:hypothetical protein